MRLTDMSHQQDVGRAPLVARAFDREAGEESPLRVESGGELLAIYRVEGESARPEAVFCPAQ